jgi:hypothetical protein
LINAAAAIIARHYTRQISFALLSAFFLSFKEVALPSRTSKHPS